MKKNKKVFGILQRVGRSFMLPIAILPIAGLLLGIGSSFTNEVTIASLGLQDVLGSGTVLNGLLIIMSKVGGVVFDNLSLIFAVGVAIGMAQKEKGVAALSAVVAFFVMNISINAMLSINGKILPDGSISPDVLSGTIANVCGIQSLQMGVFAGVIVGLGVAALHNKFYKIQLPNALSFFGGTRFVPIISTIVYMFVGIFLYYEWPLVQNGIYALGDLVNSTGYAGTLVFGLIKRALIPFGLHHVFYMPFWQTALGGTMEVAGNTVSGGQNIFFAQLADSANITHFSADATRYFSGEFIFMIFGLPGAALAMYTCAKPEKKKQAGGLLFSAALTCMFTGITEPIEFSFLFVAPVLFVVQVVLAGTAYMIAHILNIAVGLTFSGGLLDLFFFGILQGNDKTSWLLIIPVGIVYFFLYFFIFRFLILKFNFKTPGREDDNEETKLYTKADVNSKNAAKDKGSSDADSLSKMITAGLGGKKNISDVDCCATRLRCTVIDENLVKKDLLKSTGASGVVCNGTGIQVIYGPRVSVIKSELEEYLDNLPDDAPADKEYEKEAKKEEKKEAKKVAKKVDKKVAKKEEKKEIVISSPITGKSFAITETPDEAFAEKMMGDGAAVLPEEPVIVAPEDGTVDFVFDTKHAVGFTTDSGVNLLIHIGIDTVKLDGKGFEVLVENGQQVKKGDPLMKIDIKYLSENAKSLISPVICSELDDNQVVEYIGNAQIKAGEPLFIIK